MCKGLQGCQLWSGLREETGDNDTPQHQALRSRGCGCTEGSPRHPPSRVLKPYPVGAVVPLMQQKRLSSLSFHLKHTLFHTHTCMGKRLPPQAFHEVSGWVSKCAFCTAIHSPPAARQRGSVRWG